MEYSGPGETLPGLEFSQKQLFWIAAANVWCGKSRPAALRNQVYNRRDCVPFTPKFQVLTNSHSPAKFRVIGSFSNSKEFSQDWKCPLGSPMNPEQKCAVFQG